MMTIDRQNLPKTINNQRGSTLIGALFAVTLFAFSGMALIEQSASESSANTNEMQTVQALQVGTGGLENARYLLDFGLSPDVVDKSLGFGSYTVSSDPATGTVSVDSQVGQGKKVQSITADFSKNCVEFDTSNAFTAGANLQGISLVKTCNQEAVITKIILDWNWSTCVLNSNNPLADCPNNHADHDHGGAVVEEIHLNNTPLYDPDNGYGTPTGEAEANESIDVADYALTSDGTYLFVGIPDSILFSQNHPGNGLYFITIEFADGSQISETFHDQTLFGVVGGGPGLGLETDQGVVTLSAGNEVTAEVACGSDSASGLSLGLVGSPDEVMEQFLAIEQVIEGSVSTSTTVKSSALIVTVDTQSQGNLATISSKNTLQVKTLMNGEQSPITPSSMTVAACAADYIDASGAVTLSPNQVLLLIELDVDLSSDPDCPSADYQDVVIVLTLEPEQEQEDDDCEEDDEDDEEDEDEEEDSDSDDDDEDEDDEGCNDDDSDSEDDDEGEEDDDDEDEDSDDDEDDEDENEDSEDDECTASGKFLICHVPPGNSGNPQTLCVDENGWENGHSGGKKSHDEDYLGVCNE